MDTQAPSHLCSPRDYAAAILAEPQRERRAALLERCPKHWQALVREYVEVAFAKVAAYRQHKAARTQLARSKPPAAPRRDANNSVIHHGGSAPEVGNTAIANLRAVLGQGGV